jgi:hypothetical protein
MIEILTALLVFITGFYAWISYRILKANEGVLKEMQLQQEALSRPYISISPVVFPDNPCFFLKIKNTGKTAAKNLKLKMDKDFYKFGNKGDQDNLRNLRAFKENIDSFVPGAEMLFYLAQSFVVFGENPNNEKTPDNFIIVADYEYASKKVSERTIVDLRPFLDSAMPQDPIVQKIQQLTETIEKKIPKFIDQ